MVKHQTNVNELKRSFLETDTGIPGLTEWERRLSSSPARSPRMDEPPMIEPLDLQDVSTGWIIMTCVFKATRVCVWSNIFDVGAHEMTIQALGWREGVRVLHIKSNESLAPAAWWHYFSMVFIFFLLISSCAHCGIISGLFPDHWHQICQSKNDTLRFPDPQVFIYVSPFLFFSLFPFL